MKLELYRYSSNDEDTLGLLFVDGKFFCYTLEDEHRNEKKYGETRIPAGRYDIEYRTVGGFHNRYSARFPELHKGMLQLKDVPDFEYILIHTGNDDDDTAGCLMVGNSANNNQVSSGWISNSTDAYRYLYPVVAGALDDNQQVQIEIIDWDLDLPKKITGNHDADISRVDQIDDVPLFDNSRFKVSQLLNAFHSNKRSTGSSNPIAEIAIPDKPLFKRFLGALKRTFTGRNKTGKALYGLAATAVALVTGVDITPVLQTLKTPILNTPVMDFDIVNILIWAVIAAITLATTRGLLKGVLNEIADELKEALNAVKKARSAASPGGKEITPEEKMIIFNEAETALKILWRRIIKSRVLGFFGLNKTNKQ